jgi:hypothetical protein
MREVVFLLRTEGYECTGRGRRLLKTREREQSDGFLKCGREKIAHFVWKTLRGMKRDT